MFKPARNSDDINQQIINNLKELRIGDEVAERMGNICAPFLILFFFIRVLV
jgi:hypothetical protein